MNWRLVVRRKVDTLKGEAGEGKQPLPVSSDEEATMVMVRKEEGKRERESPPPKVGRWEIFDESRLRKVRHNYLIAFVIGVLVTWGAMYSAFLVPLKTRVAALESRETDMNRLIAHYEEQARHLTEILASLEAQFQEATPSTQAPAVAAGEEVVQPSGVEEVATPPAQAVEATAAQVPEATSPEPLQVPRRSGVAGGALPTDDPRRFLDTAIDTGY